MTAVTPNAKNHAGLPPKASRFVNLPDMAWETSPLFPGIETKTLLFDPANAQVTVLMRLAPGARVPDHEHGLTEQTYVMQGSLVCGEGVCKAGEFVWRPAGRRPGPATRAGCSSPYSIFPSAFTARAAGTWILPAMNGTPNGATC